MSGELAAICLLPGFDPLAAIYAGHQFGVFVPQLGDGRAILLGEAVGTQGRWDLQLKGAGKTPYSRMGDGRAVLRSSIREYLASEAMHALGIPTTRALAIVGSDQALMRENIESAAVLTRMSPSHVRFGSFELFASRRQLLKQPLNRGRIVATRVWHCPEPFRTLPVESPLHVKPAPATWPIYRTAQTPSLL